ncbi:hypothetical protein EVAR_15661_1 [Eumeta japonica]|uniref:Uncharacterized protein n=1 Tax=Eumeta variegata TaxID=151549 RepID=A0A4C1UA95_EUMVA|nr:hypothetical protein EVAR_15661_1 [Eumeta japonica]
MSSSKGKVKVRESASSMKLSSSAPIARPKATRSLLSQIIANTSAISRQPLFLLEPTHPKSLDGTTNKVPVEMTEGSPNMSVEAETRIKTWVQADSTLTPTVYDNDFRTIFRGKMNIVHMEAYNMRSDLVAFDEEQAERMEGSKYITPSYDPIVITDRYTSVALKKKILEMGKPSLSDLKFPAVT